MVSSFVPLVSSGLPSRWGGTGVFLGGVAGPRHHLQLGL